MKTIHVEHIESAEAMDGVVPCASFLFSVASVGCIMTARLWLWCGAHTCMPCLLSLTLDPVVCGDSTTLAPPPPFSKNIKTITKGLPPA